MKLGNITFKRRYSLVWLLADLLSAAALFYIGFIVYSCALDIEQVNRLNQTETDLGFLRWEPLLLWVGLGAVVWAVSLFLILRPRKMPKKYFVNEKNAVRFCGTVDIGICCVRLLVLLALSEGCYFHMTMILQRFVFDFTTPIVDLATIAAAIAFTRIRLRAISDSAKAEEEKQKERRIIEG
ncbi:MAG: hypothetical protein NC084_00605 [Bacteroides sp.]|nr:hypothetical protein [Eubacterium sp.]MCM1417190.1 hypothetical protein [Roseburia sp.]MCM1461189.1 hypothetical protein [Bacteroides sp.]